MGRLTTDPENLPAAVDEITTSIVPVPLMWTNSDFGTGMSMALTQPRRVTTRVYHAGTPQEQMIVRGERVRLSREGKGDWLDVDLASARWGMTGVFLSGQPSAVAAFGLPQQDGHEWAEVVFSGRYFRSREDRERLPYVDYPNKETALVALGFRFCS